MWFRRRAVLELGGAAAGGAVWCALAPEAWVGMWNQHHVLGVSLRLTVNGQPPLLYQVTSQVVSSHSMTLALALLRKVSG